MKKLLLSLALVLTGIAASAQTESLNDSISHGISLDNFKSFDGFLLDMNMMVATPPPLTLPIFDISELNGKKNYYQFFQFTPTTIYSKESLYLYTGYGLNGFGFNPTAPAFQKASFQLKNGMRINTYGEYDADGYKVRNPSALPWERNNFNGAFEMKSENGNFGIRIEVQRGRTMPY